MLWLIAAVAAIAEHSICRMYGAGRPDDEDAKVLASFGLDIINKVNDTQSFVPLALSGNRPYKQGCSGPYPTANDGCAECGACASECPTTTSKLSTRNFVSVACDVFLFVQLKQEA